MSSKSGPRRGGHSKSGAPSNNSRGGGNSSNGFKRGGGKGPRGSGSGYQDRYDRQPVPSQETENSDLNEQVVEPLKMPAPTPSIPSATHKSYAAVLAASTPSAVGDELSKSAVTASVDSTSHNSAPSAVSETASEDDLKSSSEPFLKEKPTASPTAKAEVAEKQPVKVSSKLRADVPEFNPFAAEFTHPQIHKDDYTSQSQLLDSQLRTSQRQSSSSKRFNVPARPVSAPPPPEIPPHQHFTAYTHRQSHKDIYSATQANSTVPISNSIVPSPPVIPRRSYNVLTSFPNPRSGPGPSYPHAHYQSPYYPASSIQPVTTTSPVVQVPTKVSKAVPITRPDGTLIDFSAISSAPAQSVPQSSKPSVPDSSSTTKGSKDKERKSTPQQGGTEQEVLPPKPAEFIKADLELSPKECKAEVEVDDSRLPVADAKADDTVPTKDEVGFSGVQSVTPKHDSAPTKEEVGDSEIQSVAQKQEVKVQLISALDDGDDLWTEDSDDGEDDIEPAVYEVSYMLKLKDSCTAFPSRVDDTIDIIRKGSHVLFDDDRFRSFKSKGIGKGPYHSKPNLKRDHTKSVRRTRFKLPELEVSEGAWKRKRPANEVENLTRKVQSILNKLTLEKFDVLSTELIDLVKKNVSDSVTLGIVVHSIYEKALFAPKFSSMYARLCSVLQEHFPTFTETVVDEVKGESKGIRCNLSRILLTECQHNFEKGITEIPYDESKSKAEIDESRHMQKVKFLSLVIFIGHIYQRGMLTDRVIKACIAQLFKQTVPSDEVIESAVKFLTTIGKKFESVVAGKDFMELAFRNINVLIANKEQVSSRMRFLLLDLVELRANQWVPRRKIEEARTIDEIHKDAELEKKAALAAPIPRPKSAGLPPRSFSSATPPQSASLHRYESEKPSSSVEVQPDTDFSPHILENSSSEVESRILSMVKEFYNINDVDEFKLCLEDLETKAQGNPRVFKPEVFRILFTEAAGGKDIKSSLSKALKAITACTESGHFVVENIRGFQRVLFVAEDISADLPKFNEFVGNFLGDLIISHVLPIKHLQELWERSFVKSQLMVRILIIALKHIKSQKSEEDVVSLLKSEYFDPTIFMKLPYWWDIVAFLKANDLTYLFAAELDICSEISKTSQPLNLEQFRKVLATFTITRSWIMRFLLEKAVEETTGKGPSLKRYSSCLKELASTIELQTLYIYEIQKLMRKQRRTDFEIGFLLRQSVENGIISVQGYEEWAKCKYFWLGKSGDKQITDWRKSLFKV